MNKKSSTTPDQHILQLLQKTEKPLSAYKILDSLRHHGVRSPPTVYRALHRLVKRGIIHRLETLNAFIACAHNGHDGANGHLSAFAICSSCGAVQEIHNPLLAQQIKKIGRDFLARLDQENLELSGLCSICLQKKEAKEKHHV